MNDKSENDWIHLIKHKSCLTLKSNEFSDFYADINCVWLKMSVCWYSENCNESMSLSDKTWNAEI